MSQRRPHHSACATFALSIGLIALLVTIVALVIAGLASRTKEPRGVHPQRQRALLLPILPDEPPAQAILGPAAMAESEHEGTAPQPDRGRAQTEAPWYGLCSPKSVASLDDFRQVVHRDQRLAAYYSGFNWAKARLVTTAEPRLVYVSYQKAGIFARTKHPILLPRGDTLLTDGVLQARTYCCNEVFELVDAPPPPPVEGDQPAAPLPPLTQAPWPPAFPPSVLAAPAAAPPVLPPSARGVVPPSFLLVPPAVPPVSPPSTPGDVPPLERTMLPPGPTFPPPPLQDELLPSFLARPPALAFPPSPASSPALVPVSLLPPPGSTPTNDYCP